MTQGFAAKLLLRYHDYVNTFRDASGALPRLLLFKRDHSDRVMLEANHVMMGERWEPNARRVGEAAALLHDTARYVQFHAFGTFRDRESFDHADASVEIIQQQGWLRALPEAERHAILSAVRFHNKRGVPPSLTGFDADVAHLVRDADKLDIFRILETAVNDGSLARHPEIAWGLQMEGAPNPEIIEAVSNGESVNYDAIRVFADFVLIQVGWLNGGLHFKTTARFAIERKTLEFRETLLKTLTDDHSGIEHCCAAARKSLEAKTLGHVDTNNPVSGERLVEHAEKKHQNPVGMA